MTTDDLDIAQVASDILESARARAGKAAALARTLEQMGVVGEGGIRYSESAISNWIRRRARPPAEAVLAAAVSQGISIDARLGIDRQDEEPTDRNSLSERVARLEQRLGSVLQLVETLQEDDRVQRQLLDGLLHPGDPGGEATVTATWESEQDAAKQPGPHARR